MALKLGGEELAGEVDIASIIVPGTEVQKERLATPGRQRLPMAIAAVVLFILAGTMSYFFWIRPQPAHVAELRPTYTTVERSER